MQNTEYFNINSFDSYLKENTPMASLKKKLHRNSEDIFLENIQDYSFQIVETDFLANQSVTQGRFTKNGIQSYWEEFRIRFKLPIHFNEKNTIPKGKYRIRVQKTGEKKIVKTFIRKSLLNLGIINWWKEENLPSSIPLDRILIGNIEDYIIKQD